MNEWRAREGAERLNERANNRSPIKKLACEPNTNEACKNQIVKVECYDYEQVNLLYIKFITKIIKKIHIINKLNLLII